MHGVRGPISTVVLLVFVVALMAAFAASSAAGGAGAERLAATCVAEMRSGGVSSMWVFTDEFPKYWPIDFFGPSATARGDATFAPGGQVNVNCVFDGHTSPAAWWSEPLGPDIWPSGTFTGSSPCRSARGGGTSADPAALYEGRATVTTVKKTPDPFGPAQVKISCHMEQQGTWP